MIDKKAVSITPEQRAEIKRRIETAKNKPLVVTVMGQTGVGKTSLINALFGTKMKTNDIQPETKVPEKHIEYSEDGHQLWFWDMPGIGESSSADTNYLNDYLKKILEADIALWLCHVDSRSITFDLESIQKMLGNLSVSEQTTLLSKLTFVLSKADVMTPEPWILYKESNGQVLFEVSDATQKLLDAKAAYFKEALITPFGSRFVSRTFHDGKFDLQFGELTYDSHFAYYSGLMSPSVLKQLQQRHPKYTEIFTRLYRNSEVIYCSSRFRYNLAKLMSVIVNKLGGEASMRFRSFTSKETMNRVSWEKAKTFSNIIVFDAKKKDIVFNLEEMK